MDAARPSAPYGSPMKVVIRRSFSPPPLGEAPVAVDPLVPALELCPSEPCPSEPCPSEPCPSEPCSPPSSSVVLVPSSGSSRGSVSPAQAATSTINGRLVSTRDPVAKTECFHVSNCFILHASAPSTPLNQCPRRERSVRGF